MSDKILPGGGKSPLKKVFGNKIGGLLDPSDGGRNIGGLIDPGGTIIERATGSSFARDLADPIGIVPKNPQIAIDAAKKQQATADEKIRLRQQKENARLASATGDVARRKAAGQAGRGGRSLLIATSPTGTRATNLGGTA